ncbi:MAG: biopolymer transporter ExbD [Chlamydiae bacterium]|nr:biopolymer transporter ExbD [Chlamydiota bacterium]
MQIIPQEELEKQKTLNLTPMVDFLFLVLAIFAVLAITRTALYDSEVSLVKMTPGNIPGATSLSEPSSNYTIILTMNDAGKCKLITEINEFVFDSVASVKAELLKQEQMGIFPEEKEKIKVLLHIDRNAKWQSIAEVILAIKELGLQISPVYEPNP